MKLKVLWKETFYVRYFGFTKIPLIWFLRPRVLRNDEDVTEVVLPNKRRSRNHLGSMYFGALATGADLAGGLTAMTHIERSGKSVSLAFKSFQAHFHKRPHFEVHFRNTEGREIKEFVAEVLESSERLHKMVTINAYCPKEFGEEPVATFQLELSLKKKN